MRLEQFNGFGNQTELKMHREDWREINHLCQKILSDVQEAYADSGRYRLSVKARGRVQEVAGYLEKVSGQASPEQALILVLDFLRNEIGALPDDLGDLYVEKAFSAEEIRRHQGEDADTHLAFKKVAEEIKQKGISLDSELVRRRMKLTEQELQAAGEISPLEN